MIQNIVIGEPLIPPEKLLAKDQDDWEDNEKRQTLFTQTRFLPTVLKEAGIVSSTSEVRRNRPDLMKELTELDFLQIKIGKKTIFIVVGN